MDFYKSIGKLTMCITINNDLYADFLNTFLAIEDKIPKREDVNYKVNILFTNKSQHPDIQLDLSSSEKIKLMNATYYYQKQLNLYYVNSNHFSGIINMNKHEANWYVYEMIEPRTLFHLLILDPISLIAPHYNLLIGHGAVIKENNQAHIIFGHSGMGKSTISRLLSNHFSHLKKFSDDTFAFEVSNGGIKVFPFNTGEGYLKSYHDKNKVIQNTRIDGEKVIIENNEKFYILIKLTTQRSPLQLKNSFFLVRDDSIDGTQIKELNSVDYLREMLETHTSIPSIYTQKKFSLWKAISDQSNGFLIRYREFCDVEKLAVFMGWRNEKSI